MTTQTSTPSNGTVTVVIDSDRAWQVLDILMSDYFHQKRLYGYVNRSNAPQTIYRPRSLLVGSIEHARWLFFAAMTDRREMSEMVYLRHQKLWYQQADALYNNPLDAKYGLGSLKKILGAFEFGMPDTAARDWHNCSATLFTWLAGDPRNLYRDRSIDDIVRMKSRGWNLSGFGSKILSLLAIFYAELEMIELPKDAFPVDVHVQRFALATGIGKIDAMTRNVHLERALRPLLANICLERGWSAVDVSHAIWFLGNRLCTTCSRTSMAEHFCPAFSLCDGPFETKEYFKKGLWDPNSQTPKGSQRLFGLPNLADGLYSTS